jgi:broad specificity phosphatase PhoE
MGADKHIYFIRHSVSEMNEFLRCNPWGSDKFHEPGLWDTRLTSAGIELCHTMRPKLHDPTYMDLDRVDLLVTTPLTRTIQTANYLFFHGKPLLSLQVSRLVQPLLAERLYMASDAGRPKEILAEEFPEYDFSMVPDGKWWYEHCDMTHKPYVEWRPPGKLSFTQASHAIAGLIAILCSEKGHS